MLLATFAFFFHHIRKPHACQPCLFVEVHSRLLTQEERCQSLEKQLEQTRIMVHQAERDRAEALRKMAALHSDNLHVENAERRSYIDKISDLEREQLKLMATQTLAQVVTGIANQTRLIMLLLLLLFSVLCQ